MLIFDKDFFLLRPVPHREACQPLQHRRTENGINFYETRAQRNITDRLVTFERLWNWARETFALVWSLIEAFIWRNSVLKSLQKIWSENSQKRRPRGSSINHGEIWPAKFGQMCLPQIFQIYLLHFVWIVNFIFPCVRKWNGSEIKLFERVFNRN